MTRRLATYGTGLGLALLVSLASTGRSHAADGSPSNTEGAGDDIVQVPPVVDWTTADGGNEPERGGTWTLDAPDRADPSGDSNANGETTHQVVFLLDVSASMPNVHSGRLDAVVNDVERRARQMLEPYVDSGLLDVSFYRFGDLRRSDDQTWQPHVEPLENGRDLNARRALENIEGFFPEDPSAYDEKYTYVAASVYEAVRRELNVGGEDPPRRIPADAPPISVLAFTDTGNVDLGGGESHAGDRDYDHAPYREWLENHRDRHQLQYYHWNLETESYPELPGEGKMTYVANWPDAGRVDSFNLQQPLGDRSRQLDIPERIRLIPSLMGSDGGDGGLICRERDRRDRVDFPRTPIQLALRGAPTYNVGAVDSYAPGEHPVRFAEDELCRQLTAVYPDSEFRLPSRDGELQRLGYVEVVDIPHYAVSFGADGTTPDAPLEDLRADRFHRYGTRTRQYYVSNPDESEARLEIEWSADISRDGEPIEAPEGFFALTGSRDRSAMSAVTSPGERVTLELPGARQRWWSFGADFPFRPDDYAVEVCATPRVTDAPSDNYRLEVQCDDCTRPESGGSTVCSSARVRVAEPPLHWLWWLVMLATLLVLAWATRRWISSPPFPDRVRVDVSSDGAGGTSVSRILSPQINTLQRALYRFDRKPYFLVIAPLPLEPYLTSTPPDIQTPDDANESDAADDGDEETGNSPSLACLGLRGSPTGEELEIWLRDVGSGAEKVSYRHGHKNATPWHPARSRRDALEQNSLKTVGSSEFDQLQVVIEQSKDELGPVVVQFSFPNSTA